MHSMYAPQPFPLTEPLKQAILELAGRAEIRSISCPFDDFDLWKGLLAEQVRRSKETGLPPQKALGLIGPDSGIPGVDDGVRPSEPDPATGSHAPDCWGGEVHIPFEGTIGADLFILPAWHRVFPDSLARPDAKLPWLVGKPCNFLLTNRNLGLFNCATRTLIAGCFLYASNGPHTAIDPLYYLQR